MTKYNSIRKMYYDKGYNAGLRKNIKSSDISSITTPTTRSEIRTKRLSYEIEKLRSIVDMQSKQIDTLLYEFNKREMSKNKNH